MLLLSFCIFSCSKEDDNSIGKEKKIPDSENYSNSDLYKEASILVGNLLRDEKVRTEIINSMEKLDEHNELVSMSYLLDKEIRKKNEAEILEKNPALKKRTSNFRIALEKEFRDNHKNYKVLSDKIKSTDSKSSEDILRKIVAFLSEENMQIYLPSNDTVLTKQVHNNDYYISYATLDGSPTNDAYYFENSNINGYTIEENVDNNFIDTHQAYIIAPIDDCDLVGYDCEFTELYATSEPIQLIPDDPYAGGGGGGGLPDPIGGPELITGNYNNYLIPERDIISSRIPEIRINGNDWTGFGATHQKLRFFRASVGDNAGRNLTQKPDGSITAPAYSYTIGAQFRTRTKNVRDKNWVSFDNTEFDDDWNMSEHGQEMAVFSIHHLQSSAEATLKAKAALDAEGEATLELSGESEVKVSVGSAKFRANKELTRKQVLSTVIGANPSGIVRLNNGINYNVKQIGIIDFYFKHYHTDLSD